MGDVGRHGVVRLADVGGRVLAGGRLEAHRAVRGDEPAEAVAAPHLAVVTGLGRAARQRQVGRFLGVRLIDPHPHVIADVVASDLDGGPADVLDGVFVFGAGLDPACHHGRRHGEPDQVFGAGAHHLDVASDRDLAAEEGAVEVTLDRVHRLFERRPR